MLTLATWRYTAAVAVPGHDPLVSNFVRPDVPMCDGQYGGSHGLRSTCPLTPAPVYIYGKSQCAAIQDSIELSLHLLSVLS